VVFNDLYMFSRCDGILLGRTHDRGNWSLDVDNAVRDQVVAKHKQLFDSMRGC
jgi:hypothetical protein